MPCAMRSHSGPLQNDCTQSDVHDDVLTSRHMFHYCLTCVFLHEWSRPLQCRLIRTSTKYSHSTTAYLLCDLLSEMCHPSACQHVDSGPIFHLPHRFHLSSSLTHLNLYTFHRHVVCGGIWNVFVVRHAVSAVVHVPQRVRAALHGSAVSGTCLFCVMLCLWWGMFRNVSVRLSVVHHFIFPLNSLSTYLNAHCYLLCLQRYSGLAKYICSSLKNDGCVAT